MEVGGSLTAAQLFGEKMVLQIQIILQFILILGTKESLSTMSLPQFPGTVQQYKPIIYISNRLAPKQDYQTNVSYSPVVVLHTTVDKTKFSFLWMLLKG